MVNSKCSSNMKQSLGQFYTKNYEYILQTIQIPDTITQIIEPFAGEADLLNYIVSSDNTYDILMYDIDPKQESIQKRDTLLNPPEYQDKFVITNPPYLARNKSESKEVYDKYDVNDLYKCFLVSLLNDVCEGGILIIPLNFLCSTRKQDCLLRKRFLSVYSIQQVNIFEEQVFTDTSCTVCSFLFLKGAQTSEIPMTVYPSKQTLHIDLSEKTNYSIGGHLYEIQPSSKYHFKRLTSQNLQEKNTHIVVKCIDDNSQSMIRAMYVDESELFVDTTPKCSARGYMTLIITPPINETTQKKVVNDFNTWLTEERKQYHSLFLANYRESKDIARKRISFDLVYKLMGHLLEMNNS